MLKKNFFLLIIGVWVVLCVSEAWGIPNRRRSYDEREENVYLIVPAIASLPGIGIFAGAITSVSNLWGTGMDVAATVAESIDSTEISVKFFALREIPLLIPGLTVDYWSGNFKLGNFQSYLPGRDSPDFTIPVTGEIKFQLLQPALRLFERRLNLIYSVAFADGFNFDENGREIRSAQHGADGTMFLDLTDDVVDPYDGIRFYYRRSLPAPTESVLGTDAVVDTNKDQQAEELLNENLEISTYTSLSEYIVWAMDYQYFRVTGREDSEEVIAGGSPPLRGYPEGRWSDRYGVYFAVEPRINFPSGRPIDFALASGTLDAYQLAFFYELGQVSPDATDLYKDMHESRGVGIRFLFDAIILRLDAATSDAGPQTHLTINHHF